MVGGTIGCGRDIDTEPRFTPVIVHFSADRQDRGDRGFGDVTA